ncbi:MAG TPA: hypothetical protein VFQ36_01915 [Ktedonobacteraceae bacterium]|nr:hypothetical protein [Ktedonobacteraceae bacterium]
MEQGVDKVERSLKPFVAREVKWWTWKRILLAAVLVLVVLEIGTYAFNWNWTGFKNNDTVWDYLQLLLLPVTLAAVPIWFMAEENQQRIWLAQLKIALLIIAVVLVVLFIGTYAYNWQWTGFHDHGRLWDWLGLVLVPIVVAVLPIWYSIRHSTSSDGTSAAQPQQAPQGTGDHPQQAL